MVRTRAASLESVPCVTCGDFFLIDRVLFGLGLLKQLADHPDVHRTNQLCPWVPHLWLLQEQLEQEDDVAVGIAQFARAQGSRRHHDDLTVGQIHAVETEVIQGRGFGIVSIHDPVPVLRKDERCPGVVLIRLRRVLFVAWHDRSVDQADQPIECLAVAAGDSCEFQQLLRAGISDLC